MPKMFSRFQKICCAFLCMLCVIVSGSSLTQAAIDSVDYQNQTTGYRFVIQDTAGLLASNTEDEMLALMNLMNEITDYCNVAFYTTDYNTYSSTETLAQHTNEALFGSDTTNAVIFVIDMDERMLVIDAMGSTRKVITSAYCNTITDNVYRYASDEEYYTCTYKVFEQIQSVLAGQHIAQPMKYICNVFLALILAMLCNFFLVRLTGRKSKAANSELLSGIYKQSSLTDIHCDFINQTKTYSPQSSGSSSGGGGGGHSSGGGGGHSSGGHSF